MVAFAAALPLDGPVARRARATGVAAAVIASHWSAWVKAPGTFWFTVVVVGGLWLAGRIDGRRALYVLAVAAAAGLNFAVKWVVGRTRPFKLAEPIGVQPRPFELHPFPRGLIGLFDQPKNLSFPSGHECTAVALAVGVWVVYRPGGWALLPLAAAVGVERVAENAHYVSDVVGGVGWAAGGAAVAWAVMGRWVERPATRGFPVGLAPLASDAER